MAKAGAKSAASGNSKTKAKAANGVKTSKQAAHVAANYVSAIPGRFSYLFPDLQVDPNNMLPTDANGQLLPAILNGLKDLADSMKNPGGGSDSAINSSKTYLNFFIDHDLSFDPTSDPTSTLIQRTNPNTITNLRTASFDLSILYGGGPAVSPFLYDGDKLRQGGYTLGRDLPRAINTSPFEGDRPTIAQALTVDPRSDSNLIISQLHCAFIAFHNSVVDMVVKEGVTADQVFIEASRRVRWHYQWIAIKRQLFGQIPIEVFNEVSSNPNIYYVNDIVGTIPVEFSMAANLFGYSMMRESYAFNPRFGPASLQQLFATTGSKIPSAWERISWNDFMDFSNHALANKAKAIDTNISSGLYSVTGQSMSIPEWILKRGYALNLPTGQPVAIKLGVPVLTPQQISQTNGNDNSVFTANPVFTTQTPLWYYILKESELTGGGRLGAVGSRIVAEVFFGILRADPNSYVNSPLGTNWVPTIPPVALATPPTPLGQFRIADVVVYAGHALPDGTPT